MKGEPPPTQLQPGVWRDLTLLGLLSLAWIQAEAQSAVSSTWHLPLDDMALQVRMARDSGQVVVPSIQPLSTWLRPASLKPTNKPFQGLNVVGEFRAVQSLQDRDGLGSGFHAISTAFGLATRGAWNHRWAYQASVLRWRIPLGSPLANEVRDYRTIDGLGRAQLLNASYAFADRVEWALSRTLSPSVEMRVGQESHHWGPGARSLFLDRHMAPALGARLWVDAGLVQYSHLLIRTVHPLANRDSSIAGWMAAHMAEVSLGAGWTGSVFGAVKWRNSDLAFDHRIDPHYLVPFVAFRPREYHQGSADNALIGLQLTKRFASSQGYQWTIYGQLLLDELLVSRLNDGTQWWGNKWGLLAGAHGTSATGRWGWLAEGACVRPWVYAHNTEPLSFTHLHQPLGHPGGANFVEGRVRLRHKPNAEWVGRLSLLHRVQGLSTGTSETNLVMVAGELPTTSTAGRNGDDGHAWLQGVNASLTRVEVDVSRFLGTKFGVGGIEAFLRVWARIETQQGGVAWTPEWNTHRIEVGVRHSRVMQERDW